MTTREDVLAYFEQQGEGRGTVHVAGHFECSLKAAAKHVAKLWMEQLIEETMQRPRGTRFRLGAYEHLEGLRFRLSERGRKRLAYYRLGHQAEQGQLPIG